MRHRVESIKASLERAFREVGELHDVNIVIDGSIRYSDSQMRMKIIVQGATSDGDVPDPAAHDYSRNCGRYGLPQSLLDDMVTIRGTIYRVIGLKPRNRKYPIICLDVLTGKRYKMAAQTVREGMQS